MLFFKNREFLQRLIELRFFLGVKTRTAFGERLTGDSDEG